MDIRSLGKDDIEVWIDMRHRFWPQYERQELVGEALAWARGKTGVFVADSGGDLVGFAEVTMHDRAPGCTTSPVGYLEGWWVEADYRRSGVGSALLAATEEWARERGAVELASDAYASDDVSRAVHPARGFEELRAVARFHKSIAEDEVIEPDVEADAPVTLREITGENVRDIIKLDVAPHQKAFVAPNAISLAQYGVTTKAWTRAVYAGDTPVGYVLLSDDDEKRRYYLWRFMIDRCHQGRGLGAAAMGLVIDYVKGRPGAEGLYTSYVPISGGPEGFYKSLGFTDTGEEDEGEIETYLAF
ncbi:MAG: GNAT family N-acetyltransferase [Actinomycetota bacterium]